MILELTLSIIIGILIGTITGLIPGLHINLIIVILLASLSNPLISNIPPIALVLFIVSLSITHIIIDFIPTSLLGVPEEDSFLAILPAHKFLLRGKALQAVSLLSFGALTSSIFIIPISIVFIFLIPKTILILSPIIPFILLFTLLFSTIRENNLYEATIVTILGGVLGYLTFSLPVKEPLLPILTGLFGLPALILSIKNKTKIPKQMLSQKPDIKINEIISSLKSCLISAPL